MGKKKLPENMAQVASNSLEELANFTETNESAAESEQQASRVILSQAGVKDGVIYVIAGCHKVFKVHSQTLAISVIAGTGEAGYSGDGGLAITATLCNPTSVAASSNGEIFIGDQGGKVLRRVTLQGQISTVVQVQSHV